MSSAESPVALRLDPSDLLGSWLNSDRGVWGGVARLQIREHQGALNVAAFGVGRPAEFEWGESEATLYTTPALTPRAYGFDVTFDLRFMATDISAYYNNGILVTTTYNVYHDGSGRSDYWTREFFRRTGG